MSLPTSGALSINSIKTELGVSYNDIRALSDHIGLSTPDSFSEFYGKNGSVSISPVSRSVDNSSGSFTITITTDNAWTASDNAGWLSLSTTSGIGNATITVTHSTNSGSARTGTVTVSTAKNSDTTIVSQATGATTTSVSLGFGNTASAACTAQGTGNNVTRYMPLGQGFSTATHLYSNSAGTTNAPTGYYSQSGIWRYWTGNSFSGSAQSCNF